MSSSEIASLKSKKLHKFKLKLNKWVHKNSLLFETRQLIQLQTETQQISS